MRRFWAQWNIVTAATLRGYSKDEIIFLLAQAALETGNFSSLWYEDRNLFGMSEMRNAARRRRLRGVRLGPDGLMRAQFRSLWSSVQDRLDWDEQLGIERGPNYGASVGSKYHTSSSYADSVFSRIDRDLELSYWFCLATLPLSLLAIVKCSHLF